MSTRNALLPNYQSDAKAELHDFRVELFPQFLLWILALPLIWLIYAIGRDWEVANIYLIDLVMLLLLGTASLLASIRKKHFDVATHVFIFALLISNGVWIYVYPSLRTLAFGLIVIIISQAILNNISAFILVIMMIFTSSLAFRWGTGQNMPILDLLWMSSLYILVWFATWLASRPLRTAVARSLGGWERSFILVRQIQERRGELYRALRSLEEATYRIERMNNELLIAQRDAEEARAHKERFVTAVSHEIRGPLNLILGYSRLMALSPERYGGPLPLPYRRDVATVYRNSKHLSDLIDDILDLSQIEAESLPLVKDRVDLERDVIGKVLDMVRPLAERKELYIRHEPGEELHEVFADAVRLRQVMINILLNAVRFTERGGVTIQTGRDKDTVVVSIRDTGPGIAKEHLSGLFREFHKTVLPQDPEDKSSGLGLAISKHLIELHGGRIWVDSEPGVGTAFHVALPLPTEHSVAVGLARRVHNGPSPTGERHVIVHAPLHLVRLLSRRMTGYRILGITDPNEIPMLIDELHPHALFLGADIAEELWRKISACEYDVPVIDCRMPYTEGENQLESALAYLIKPIASETIMTVMQQVEHNGETTVLLVDDDPDAVELLEAMLLPLPRPYHILKAYDGSQALEIMEDIIPDVVFLDMLMPGLDGQETLLRMRADDRLHRVPVVIVSARDIDEGMPAVRTPITLRCKRSVDMSSMAELLKTVLTTIGPDYLVERTF